MIIEELSVETLRLFREAQARFDVVDVEALTTRRLCVTAKDTWGVFSASENGLELTLLCLVRESLQRRVRALSWRAD